MAVQPISFETEQESTSSEDLQGQVDRISESRVFEHSQTLQRLLRYLAAKSIEAPGEQIKEYTIGVEALERRPSFDPRDDTIVRVQVHRLREKLLDYYKDEGLRDLILVTIPKGRYLPIFERRAAVNVFPPSSTPPVEIPIAEERPDPPVMPGVPLPLNAAPQCYGLMEDPLSAPAARRSGHFDLRYALAIALAVGCLAVGWWIRGEEINRIGSHEGVQNSSEATKEDPAQAFWSDILAQDATPVIAFTSSLYLVDHLNDLFPYLQGAIDDRGAPVDASLARRYASNPALIARAGNVYYESGYTGTGDLKGVALLERFFTRMGVTPTIKASRELTTEDFTNHTVIVLGSTFQNIAAEQLPSSGDFVFGKAEGRHEAWDREIINLHPRLTEAATYQTERDPVTDVLSADYSLVSVQPGIMPDRFIVTLAGLDTTGTEGAAIFATSTAGIQAIKSRSKFAAKELQKNHALVRVNLAKGSEVLGSSLITVHPLNARNVLSGLVNLPPAKSKTGYPSK